MPLRLRLRQKTRAFLRSEDGVAVPTVLMMVTATFAIAVATVFASISTQRSSVRDEHSKDSLGAADAGVYRALLRQNKLGLGTPTCVIGTLQADGFCSAAGPYEIGPGTFTYRVNPSVNLGVPNPTNSLGQGITQIEVVGTGLMSGVTRRVAVKGTTLNGKTVFGDERAIGLDWIDVGTGNDKGIFVNSGTNGDFTATNASSVCGNVRHGIGHQFIGQSHQCPGYSVTSANKDLPLPDLSAARTTNSNLRLANGQDPKTGNVSWNPTTKTLDMQGNSSVTLGGQDYLFCKITMSGKSSLIMAQGVAAKIYFDSPENCGLSSPATQIDITGNSSITATGWAPSAGFFELPGLYMLGSDAAVCNVNMTGNAKANEFVIYAPRCNLTLWGSSDYFGAVAGKTLSVGGAARLLSDPNLPSPNINAVVTYTIDKYVECTAVPPSSVPDSGC
jgi:hypothetical protein